MNAVRKGEVALEFVKLKIQKEGIRLSPELRREAGNAAKATGIPIEEVMEFYEELCRELVDEVFAKKDRQEPADNPSSVPMG